MKHFCRLKNLQPLESGCYYCCFYCLTIVWNFFSIPVVLYFVVKMFTNFKTKFSMFKGSTAIQFVCTVTEWMNREQDFVLFFRIVFLFFSSTSCSCCQRWGRWRRVSWPGWRSSSNLLFSSTRHQTDLQRLKKQKKTKNVFTDGTIASRAIDRLTSYFDSNDYFLLLSF